MFIWYGVSSSALSDCCLFHSFFKVVLVWSMNNFQLFLLKFFPINNLDSPLSLQCKFFTDLRLIHLLDSLRILLLLFHQLMPLPLMLHLFLNRSDFSFNNRVEFSTLDLVSKPGADFFALFSLFSPFLVNFLLFPLHLMLVVLPMLFQVIH